MESLRKRIAQQLDENNPNHEIIYQMASQIDSLRDQLISKTHNLSETLQHECNKLELQGTEKGASFLYTTVNTSGIVQYSGSEIDRLCGELGTLFPLFNQLCKREKVFV